jgi:hypothetical protein
MSAAAASAFYLWLQYAIPASIGKLILWATARKRKVHLYAWESLALVLPFALWYVLVAGISPRGWWRFFSYLPYAGIVVALFGFMRIILLKWFQNRAAAALAMLFDCVVVFLFWFFWPCMLNEACR